MRDVGSKVPGTLEIFYLLLHNGGDLPLAFRTRLDHHRRRCGGGEKDENFVGAESLGDWKAEEM